MSLEDGLKHEAEVLLVLGLIGEHSTRIRLISYSGSPSNVGTSPNLSSQTALLDEKICAVGNMAMSVSKHPAGTTSKPATWVFGNAEPHTLQKLLL